MKTLYEYNLLKADERASYPWENGSFLMNAQKEGMRVNLYSLGKFYVEVWYDNRSNEILNFHSDLGYFQLP